MILIIRYLLSQRRVHDTLNTINVILLDYKTLKINVGELRTIK